MQGIINYLTYLSTQLPVNIFVIIGGLAEEIIAPIPSPVVMMLAGNLLNTQHKGWLALLITTIIAGIAKTVGCWLWYFLADKSEDLVMTKLGKYIGISHKDIEHYGQHFKEDKSFLMLVILRAFPAMPSTPVSVVAGILKVKQTAFLLGTFLGNCVRAFFFLIIGYLGHQTYENLHSGLDFMESIFKLGFIVLGIGAIAYLYYKRSQHGDDFSNHILSKIKKKPDNK